MRSMALLLLLALPAFADDSGSTVYKKVVPSTVWIHAKHEKGTATGSGTLIDAERRLVLTNYHVVEEQPRVNVYFPAFRDGQPIAEKTHYTDRAKTLAFGAKVVARDKKADLALVQLDSLPAGKVAVPLAATGAEPGMSVHSIGNTGKSGALWGYVPGKVRQVYHKEWKADLGGGHILTFKAKVVETDSATNPGDSGGPLLNDKGELVGVTQGGAINVSLVSTFVDVSEVKKLLESDDAKAVKGAKPVAKLRDKPAVVSDGARLFKEETVKAAQKLVDEIREKKKLDVLVETFTAAPANDLEKVKAMTADERRKYMHEWVRKRMEAEKANGAGILVSSDPKSFFIELPDDVKAKYPKDFHKSLIDTLTDGLKNKKQDEAILKMLGSLRDK